MNCIYKEALFGKKSHFMQLKMSDRNLFTLLTVLGFSFIYLRLTYVFLHKTQVHLYKPLASEIDTVEGNTYTEARSSPKPAQDIKKHRAVAMNFDTA